MNGESSRSHAAFILKMTCKDTSNGSTTTGKFNLVDLAGAEKIGKTGCTGLQVEEAKAINRSLSALGNVITTLTAGKKGAHIPYRDSALTRMLQDSLGGNSKT